MWSLFFVQTHFLQFSREGKTKGGIPFDTWQVLHKEDLGNFSRRGKQHDRAGSQGGQLAGLVVSFSGGDHGISQKFCGFCFSVSFTGCLAVRVFCWRIYFFENKYYRNQLTGLGLHVFFSACMCVMFECVLCCVCFLCLDSILGILAMKTVTEHWPPFLGSKLRKINCGTSKNCQLFVKVISSETIRCLGGKFREAVFWQNWTLLDLICCYVVGSSNTFFFFFFFYGRGCNIKTWPCF